MPGTSCAECGEPLPGPGLGRPRRYCSRRCQARAYRRRRDLGRTAMAPAASSRPTPAGGKAPDRSRQAPERLIDVAVRLADAEGIGAVSMGALAHRAGLSADQVFRRTRSRDELLGAMVEHALVERAPAASRAYSPTTPEPANPREQLERLARDEWALYRRHPWLVTVLATTRPPTGPAVLAMVDRAVAVLTTAGYAPEDAFAAYLALSGYVQGMALLHVAEHTERRAGATGWEKWWLATHVRLTRTGRTQGRAWLATSHPPDRDADAVVDRWFDFGLARLLDGLLPAGRAVTDENPVEV
ncbi:TetR/AcrR family transcriptional regulator C-terminal domain-containing protein [Frankia sp. CNm7]|uniref:TetR/AcrR family transcriptional regulator C-terminal domain-containing protein n=1 Tax=Frankia nepalensis TaxID=1836974 RepID=A0A937RBD0_9ACTN|nr:TetR/AcrR family transcriptional regulator [Frankia nepalensis]MBL7498334.1 TetR/AcrR family transcriptional regulator C-terminal domain-containing protein [Frankia nepalensis]MBL7514982.1 TetR/AcrR family transcriptional regulator C-terminal domain-containing protein [Frankia nepalensis]MBL7518661.1 TetR/AcrR family transcriptional regulator C-terminal domain-containing protein [Frankia nepalensis]MBL7628941.1 TetR/AcrR family transcriptional regulator C-terminal domain-containing protein [